MEGEQQQRRQKQYYPVRNLQKKKDEVNIPIMSPTVTHQNTTKPEKQVLNCLYLLVSAVKLG